MQKSIAIFVYVKFNFAILTNSRFYAKILIKIKAVKSRYFQTSIIIRKETMKKAKSKSKISVWGYILLFLVLGALGIAFLTLKVLEALAITIGVLLAVFGVVFAIITVASKNRGAGFVVKIIFAAICITCGIVTALLKEDAVKILFFIFCLLLTVDGAFKLNTSAMSKRYSVGGWWVMMIVALAVTVSAFILPSLRFEDQSTSTLLLGIIFIVDAAANLMSAFWVSKYTAAQYAQIYLDAYNDIKNSNNP